jgi:hypothetical protein
MNLVWQAKRPNFSKRTDSLEQNAKAQIAEVSLQSNKLFESATNLYRKSESGTRRVDLHPTVAELRKGFIGERNTLRSFANK